MMKTYTTDFVPTSEELHQELQDTGRELHWAYDRFNYVTDPELVEASIYEIASLKARYSYLLRRIKEVSGVVPSPEAEIHSVKPDCIAASAMEGGTVCPS